MIFKDTENLKSKIPFFAIEDIARRAEAAYDSNQSFFDNPKHIKKIAKTREIVAKYLLHCPKVYETARPQTSKRPINTEVKFSYMIINKKAYKNWKEDIVRELVAIGIDKNLIIQKPDSISVHVT